MQKLFIVTLFFAANEKINAIKMLRSFFPGFGLAEAKDAVERLVYDTSFDYSAKEVNIAVTAEEYAMYWVAARPNQFGNCRVRNIQPLQVPTFFRPSGR